MSEGIEDPREPVGDNEICPECGVNHWLDWYEDWDDLSVIGIGLIDGPTVNDTVVSGPSDSLPRKGRAPRNLQGGGADYQGPPGRKTSLDA